MPIVAEISKHIVVRGRVQGVGYRAFVERAALQVGLGGWVRKGGGGFHGGAGAVRSADRDLPQGAVRCARHRARTARRARGGNKPAASGRSLFGTADAVKSSPFRNRPPARKPPPAPPSHPRSTPASTASP